MLFSDVSGRHSYLQYYDGLAPAPCNAETEGTFTSDNTPRFLFIGGGEEQIIDSLALLILTALSFYSFKYSF